MKTVFKNLFRSMVPLLNFFNVSEITLNKLTKLWTGYDNYLAGFELKKKLDEL
jgi:hypothetical protein